MDRIELDPELVLEMEAIAPGVQGLRIAFVNVFSIEDSDGSWTLIDADFLQARAGSKIGPRSNLAGRRKLSYSRMDISIMPVPLALWRTNGGCLFSLTRASSLT